MKALVALIALISITNVYCLQYFGASNSDGVDKYYEDAGVSRNYILALKSPFLIYPEPSAANNNTTNESERRFSTRRSQFPSLDEPLVGTPAAFSFSLQQQYLEERMGAQLNLPRHLQDQQTFSIHNFIGFTTSMTWSELQLLIANDEDTIDFIEEDAVYQLQLPRDEYRPFVAARSWGQDRIDQRLLPLNSNYNLPRVNGTTLTGKGVTVYVLDTGLAAHQECRAPRCQQVQNFAGDGINRDCQGHGSHVASTVAGSSTGIAPEATIAAVKVLDCKGSGSYSGIIAGLNWVAKQVGDNSNKRAVASMSLGGGFSATINAATNNLAQLIVVAVAAGNENQNAQNVSPASATGAGVLTVGSTTNKDARSSFSNYGAPLDIFAPGSNIVSAWPCASGSSCTCTSCYSTLSGTSMATPHVSGAAALFLQSQSYTAAKLGAFLKCSATVDRITGLPAQTANRLLFVGTDSLSTSCSRN